MATVIDISYRDHNVKPDYVQTKNQRGLNNEKDSAKVKAINEAVWWLKNHEVVVGLTSKAPARSKMLFAIHEKGSPLLNIPARTIFTPDFRAKLKKEATAQLEAAIQHAKNADLEGVKECFEVIGWRSVEAIKAKINAHIPPENSPITLHGGWMRSPITHKSIYVEGKKGDIPLVNTGQYRDSFSYEVRYRKASQK